MVSVVERTGCKNMTDKKTNCGCLFPFLPCLYQLNHDDLVRRQHSNEIDKQIAKDKEGYIRTHRLLLLGAGESGKSTIIKQMQLIHVEEFSESVRQERRNDIRNNLLEAIISILTAMPIITPPVKLDSPENEQMAQWIIENAIKPDFNFPQKFYEYTERLWNDHGVQATFERNNEYQLIDSAKYFLDKVNIIGKDNYIPSDQDILRCRVLTTGIYELVFQVNHVKFRMIDVGGQRGERRKWFLCFNDVTAIIFVTACSSYNLMLREDETKNRLRESLELFKIVWNNRWLGHISVILFLNKQDIFRDKILSKRCKLEDYFPEYRDFIIKPNEYPNENDHPDVVRGKYFIRHEFEKITLTGKQYMGHRFYPHFTCAIDTENIKRVFDDCRDSIQRKYLLEYDLI